MSFGLVKHNNNSISAITSAGQLAQGKMTLIKEQSASSSSSVSFVDGSSSVVLDSTYPIYMFKFINIHPATNRVRFQFNMSIDSGSNYNVTKTSTFYYAYHSESDSITSLQYFTDLELSQSTSFQSISAEIGNSNDESLSGELHLFDPSSTTFVKHFFSNTNIKHDNASHGKITINSNSAGYGNTTSSVDAIQFSMSSGNIDSGTIKLYGIKGS
jgi:hypothetical protein